MRTKLALIALLALANSSSFAMGSYKQTINLHVNCLSDTCPPVYFTTTDIFDLHHSTNNGVASNTFNHEQKN